MFSVYIISLLYSGTNKGMHIKTERITKGCDELTGEELTGEQLTGEQLAREQLTGEEKKRKRKPLKVRILALYFSF